MDGPVKHILRTPLPWQAESVTECGRPGGDVKLSVTRDEAAALIRKLGQARAAYELCMTCWQTAGRHPVFADDPCSAVSRVYSGYRHPEELQLELRAIAALIDLHRADFDDLVASMSRTPSLDAARQARLQARRRG